MYYNPYYGSQLIRVNGIDGARAYQMNANSTVALFDSNSDIMYIKTTDGAGFPTIRSFRFEEMTSGTDEYVSRKDFESFRKEMMDYAKQLIPTAGETEP